MVNWKEHIVFDPGVLYGKPIIRNTRIPVDLILDKLSEGESLEEILESYPHLEREDLYAALAFASYAIKNEIVYDLAS